MSKQRYVVRYTGKVKAHPLSEYWTEERQADLEAQYATYAGRYIKLGGGITPNLDEAQVVGWGRNERWTDKVCFELVPVKIVLDERWAADGGPEPVPETVKAWWRTDAQ